jgi:hypothetical protein
MLAQMTLLLVQFLQFQDQIPVKTHTLFFFPFVASVQFQLTPALFRQLTVQQRPAVLWFRFVPLL